MKYNKKYIEYDYTIEEDTFCINSLNVDKSKRRQGLGTSLLQDIEKIAKKENCNAIVVPSDLSKIALSFWQKNNFIPQDVADNAIINKVVNSNRKENFIFDFDGVSVVMLQKEL
jgi:GNAT superfamily N-acetyltransferase